MQIGELFIALGFDIDDKKLKAFKEDIKDGLESLLKISAAGAGAVYAINKFVEGAIQSSTALRDINLETGLATDAMQRWANVIETSDPSASFDQVLQSIRSIQEAITQTKLAGQDPRAFSMLGITGFMQMDANQVLEALRNSYKQNPTIFGDKTFLASLYKDLGISNPASLISAFKLSDSDFNKKFSMPIMSGEQINKNVDLGNSISLVKNRLQYMREQLTADWTPTLIGYLNQVIPLTNKFADALKSINIAVQSMGDFKWLVYTGLGALALALSPVTLDALALAGALASILYSLKQIGDYIQGKSGPISSLLSMFGVHWQTQNIRDAISKQTGATDKNWFSSALSGMVSDLNTAAVESNNIANFTNVMNGKLDTSSLDNRIINGMMKNTQSVIQNFNNTNHIHSNQDPHEIANQISYASTKMLSQARQQINAQGQ